MKIIILFILFTLVNSKQCIKTFDFYDYNARHIQMDRTINEWIDRKPNREITDISYSVNLDGWDTHKSAMILYTQEGNHCDYI